MTSCALQLSSVYLATARKDGIKVVYKHEDPERGSHALIIFNSGRYMSCNQMGDKMRVKFSAFYSGDESVIYARPDKNGLYMAIDENGNDVPHTTIKWSK